MTGRLRSIKNEKSELSNLKVIRALDSAALSTSTDVSHKSSSKAMMGVVKVYHQPDRNYKTSQCTKLLVLRLNLTCSSLYEVRMKLTCSSSVRNEDCVLLN